MQFLITFCLVINTSLAFTRQWTPVYNGQFRLSLLKAHIFSLKLTLLKWAPVNTDNGHSARLCPSHQSYYRQPRFTDSGYLRTVYFHCHS